PTTPQSAAGIRIEPPVSVPSAQSTSPAATAAAEPPEEPPGRRSSARGLTTEPWCGLRLVTPNANSWRLVLPATMQPHDRIALITGASSGLRTGARVVRQAA